jgi:thioredoxin-related protein
MQIKEKAKAENKYIFIDAFATWCVPCAAMDKKVYTNDTVANFFNEKFLSVKVQMDKTDHDNETVRSWYKDAESLSKQYKVSAYPSLIFLSPSGKIVDMDMGYKEVPVFLQMAKRALVPGKKYDDPYSEYDTLISQFKQKIYSYEKIPYMVDCALKLGDRNTAIKLMGIHLQFANTLPKEKRYVKENIEMWNKFSWEVNTPIFKFFYNDGGLIDAVMQMKGYAENLIDNCIRTQFVYPFLKSQNKDTAINMVGMYQMNNKPVQANKAEADWKKLEKDITVAVDSYYAEKNVLFAKTEWYKRYDNYDKSSWFSLQYLRKYFSFKNGNYNIINNDAFDAFKYSTEKKVIDGFIELMEKTMKVQHVDCAYLDTYANLLYKAGKRDKAIFWELKAADQATGAYSVKKEVYKKVAEQMTKGEPTWEAVWGYK